MLREHILKLKKIKSSGDNSSDCDTTGSEGKESCMFTQGSLTYDTKCALLKEANEQSKSHNC